MTDVMVQVKLATVAVRGMFAKAPLRTYALLRLLSLLSGRGPAPAIMAESIFVCVRD